MSRVTPIVVPKGGTATIFSKVLLVEDDVAHAMLVTRAIASLVGPPRHVVSGAEAVRLCVDETPDLVLCDLRLPDGTAIDFIPQFHAHDAELPVIVLTSSSDLDDAVAAMRRGAWDFMTKQFSDGFRERMKVVLDRAAERKLALIRERQMREERDAFWAAAQSAQDGVAILSRTGDILYASEAFRRFFSLVAGGEPFQGNSSLADALARQDSALSAELAEQLDLENPPSLWTSELKLVSHDKDGKEFVRSFELTLNFIRARQLDDQPLPRPDDPLRIVVWVRDITRRKEQEKFQRDLLSTTSHDLKGPLGAILNSVELIDDTVPAEGIRVRDLVTRIGSCARNCISIIDEFLSARRIQDGVLILHPIWVSLGELLDDIVLDYLPVAKAKSVNLSFSPVDESDQVYGDLLGLKRVLGNLVSNALKFTPSGGTVTLSAVRLDRETRISVTDTGRGIDPKDRHVLFERYGRLDEHAAIEGTGLGLYVTKNIIDAHNGKIEVRSEVGKGSEFVLSFPDPDE